MAEHELKSYRVWSAPVRWFHWINLLAVLGLVGIGLVILNAKALGVTNDGKILLKTLHVSCGYVLAVNLACRIVWAFVGDAQARWRALLPLGPGFGAELKSYASAFLAGRPPQYLGHNPLARIGVTVLLALLVVQAATGLVLAGTDIYFPPFGGWIAGWVAAPGVDPAALVPYADEMVDKAAYREMRAFRAPFITVHYYGFYALLCVIVAHIVGVFAAERREGGGLISAMVTGRKSLLGAPRDMG